jgi:hypothetical protein
MPIHDYVVRQEAGLWHVRCDGRLLSGQPTRLAALHLAEVLAGAAAARGEGSRIFVGDRDGSPIEFPTIETEPRENPVGGAARPGSPLPRIPDVRRG